MTYANDVLEGAMRRAHTATMSTTTLEVFEPSVSYSQGDGFDVTYPGYPGTPDATYDGRVDSPDTDDERDRSGTTSEADAVIRVRDDTGQQWTDWSDEADAPTHVRDTETGVRYEITSVLDKQDGLLELAAVER